METIVERINQINRSRGGNLLAMETALDKIVNACAEDGETLSLIMREIQTRRDIMRTIEIDKVLPLYGFCPICGSVGSRRNTEDTEDLSVLESLPSDNVLDFAHR